MFATHYHELCELAGTRKGVRNYNVAAREYEGGMVFLHKLVEGGSSRSYGVAVAKLAGVPPIVLARARAGLGLLEAGHGPHGDAAQVKNQPQLEMFATREPAPSEIESTLRELDVDKMTPLDALVALSRLRALLR